MIYLLHFIKTGVFFKFKCFTGLLLITVFSQFHLYSQINNITKEDGLTSLNVTCSYVDSKGIVWIGTSDGLNAYAGSKWYAITSIEDSKLGKSEALGRIETIFEDSEGRIWVSVMDKIFLYHNSYWTVFAETEIDDYVAKGFYEDNRGWIWVMLEHFKDFSDIPEIKFSFLGGTLEMYNGVNWYKFNEDVAGTAAYSGQGIPRYFTNIMQDKEENIWLGSLKGLYKFDGVEWIHYDEEDMISEKVLKLMLDQNGVVWAATEYGISYQQGDEWIDLTKKQGLCGTTVYDMKLDPDGRIWAYTRNNLRFSGINLIENGKCIPYDRHKTSLKGTIEQLIWNNGEIIAFASDGVSLYDKSNTWEQFGKAEGLSESKFYKIVQDEAGHIWLASNKSLYKYNEGSWLLLKEPEEWEVLTMMVDKTGAVWVGTDKKGMYKYKAGVWTQYSIGNGLIDNEVNEIFEDKKGNVWAITKKGISIASIE
ncbi:MAG: two-component regulator propeller domain-containing protein [Bacteroidales bacterium]|jgi:ligand-binding sensor domain-containing protein|nr:two-component regulator propeller domain-containing protein [Bacteroidales bacterium]